MKKLITIFTLLITSIVPGGLPLFRNGKIVGAIGVGGGTKEQDLEIANFIVTKFNERTFVIEYQLHRKITVQKDNEEKREVKKLFSCGLSETKLPSGLQILILKAIGLQIRLNETFNFN